MDAIRKQARVARRRLLVESFLSYLPWTLGPAMGLAMVGVVIPKLMYVGTDSTVWFASWMIGAAVIGVLTNTILSLLGRPSLADAAVEVDRRFGLRERLSSAMLLAPEDRETELGQALAADAEKQATRIDAREKFNWGFHRGLFVPIMPAVFAALLSCLPDQPSAQEPASPATNLTQIRNSTKPLVEQLRKKREDAEKQGLQEAVDMFRKLEGELAKMQSDPKLDTKQSLAKLNDIKEQLEKRREELGSSESLKKNLQNLEKFEQGPAEKMADALKQGDFDKAQEELEKLMEKMMNEGLNPQDLEKLQKQMEQLENAMNEAVQAHEAAKQALREQMKQAEASGDLQKAAQLERKLAEMQTQDAQMAQMQQMANMMQQAKESLQKGDKQACAECMSKLADQLSEMKNQNSELQDLDQLMDQLSQCKSGMCENMGKMPGQIPGNGLGEGRGEGERPIEENQTSFYDSRLRDQMRQGETIYGGKVGGENRKGTSKAQVQEAILTALSEEPEPLENQPLPRNQRDHTREYFNSLREGKSSSN